METFRINAEIKQTYSDENEINIIIYVILLHLLKLFGYSIFYRIKFQTDEKKAFGFFILHKKLNRSMGKI